MNARDKDFDGSARVGADLVDVTAYYGKMKLLFGLVGTAALLTFAYQYWADPDWLLKSTMYYGHGYLWGSNSWGANSYETCLQGSYSDMGCTAQTTPAAFAIQMFLRNPGDRVTDLLILSVSLLPLILFFLLRRPRPVRFNRDLGAIYGWRGGRLFILPSRYFTYDLNTAFDGLRMSDAYGEAILQLQDSRTPARLSKFKLGPYPGRQPGQPSRLLDQMTGFPQLTEAPEIQAQRPDRIRYPWWQRSLLGPKRLPGDIDQTALDWMRAQNLLA